MRRLTLALAVVLLAAGPVPAQTAPLHDLVPLLFNAGYELANQGEDAVSLAAEAVWGASELKGSGTLTGTLTQSTLNPDVWQYGPSPADRLVLLFANAPSVTFTFTTFEGYTDGGWDDFVLSHNLDFRISSPGVTDVRIRSTATVGPGKTAPRPAAPAGKTRIDWERRMTGQLAYGAETMEVDLTSVGRYVYEIDGFSGWADMERAEESTGSAQTTTVQYAVNQARWARLIHYSETGTHLRNSQVWNNTSATVNGVVYRFDDVYASWSAGSQLYGEDFNAPIYNTVIDPNYWEARGTLRQDGQAVGVFEFSKPVYANDRPMPELVLRLAAGAPVVVHSTLTGAVTTPNEPATGPAEGFALEAGYPNPFTDAATVGYVLPRPGTVALGVYDLTGRRVAVLDRGLKPAGAYRAGWDGRDESGRAVAAGIYLVRLDVDGAVRRTGRLVRVR